MAKTILESPKISKPRGVFSAGVKVQAGNLVFVSGQVARNAQGETVGIGDIKAQTRQTLETSKRCWKLPALRWMTWSKLGYM